MPESRDEHLKKISVAAARRVDSRIRAVLLCSMPGCGEVEISSDLSVVAMLAAAEAHVDKMRLPSTRDGWTKGIPRE